MEQARTAQLRRRKLVIDSQHRGREAVWGGRVGRSCGRREFIAVMSEFDVACFLKKFSSNEDRISDEFLGIFDLSSSY